jgi:hypothetical protein
MAAAAGRRFCDARHSRAVKAVPEADPPAPHTGRNTAIRNAAGEHMRSLITGFLAGLLVCPLLSAAGPNDPDEKGIEENVQTLKQQVLELNRDLFMLEEELLFPSNTQVSVFVSMDVGEFFALDSVQIKIDDKEVANYLYTKREVEALVRGGVQRIHIGNLRTGEHELVAFFTGKGPHGRDYKRGATATIDKSLGPKYVELKIVDRTSNQQPEFEVREW